MDNLSLQDYTGAEVDVETFFTETGKHTQISIYNPPGKKSHQPEQHAIATLKPEQRRALLHHLLEAEGLESLEEIERKHSTGWHKREPFTEPGDDRILSREDENGFFEVYRADDGDIGFLHGHSCLDSQWEFKPHQLRPLLSELLVAEARERVEVREFTEGDPKETLALCHSIRYSTESGEIDMDILGNAGQFECEPLTVCVPECELSTTREVEDLILCLAAALAEKRKRELEAGLAAIPEEAWEEQYADMRRRGDEGVESCANF